MQIVAKHLTGARQGESDVFNDVPLTIGRLPSSDLRLGIYDTRASARHAEIVLEKHNIVLHDVGSTNGTFVNGRKLPVAILNTGDIVEFGTGGPKLQFEIQDSPAYASSGVGAAAGNSAKLAHEAFRAAAAMKQNQDSELRAQLNQLRQEHRDLDVAIEALHNSPGSDLLQVQRLKKRKLHLRDRIIQIEDQLTPDIIA